jgi:hypothetical protein
MDTSASELVLVSDEELQKLAEELQVFAFRVADQYLTQASAPDPLSHALITKKD